MTVLPPGVSGSYRHEEPGSWPVETFQRATPPEGFGHLFDELFVDDGPLGETFAAIVLHRGAIIAERYDNALGSFISDPIPVQSTTPLLSWSMAKSMLSILIGSLVDEGKLSLDDRANIPEWSAEGDPRQAITVRDLLEMRDGLDFAEEYTDSGQSDVIEMLFGSGKDDMAHYAASRPLAVPPGTLFHYSSGTSNILSRLAGSLYGGEAGMRAALEEQLFGRLAMRSATATFDPAGTFAASSFVYATAEDFARFGLMLLQGGFANGQRIVPEWWIDKVRTPVSIDVDDGYYSSGQFWVVGDDLGTFWCSGFEGQMISVCPPLDLVVVRLGHTPDDNTKLLKAWRDRVTAFFRTV